MGIDAAVVVVVPLVIVTLLAVCGSTHGKSYFDIAMVAIVGPILALVAIIALGSMFGSF